MFSIIYEPVHGIIYKNSMKEKRVMRHSEIHKFYDAMLKRVLEGLKSYNNDVKYGYVQREPTNDEVEYLKLFEEEIECSLIFHFELVPSCLINCDLEPVSLDLELLEILNLASLLDCLCHTLPSCDLVSLDQHAYTLCHLESYLTISLDNL
ncbi:hypothetical protein Tco_0086736 [Tanacetum coccineum]